MNIENEFDSTQSQLKILSEINQICSAQSFSIWLRGGWAIDFLLGRITRSHSDIDLVTLINYREPLEQALVNAGFQKIPVSELQTDFLKDGVDVSFVFVIRSEGGNIIANGFPNWIWRKDALLTKSYKLHGISLFVLNPHQLLEEKMVHEQGTGRKLRAKDIESLKTIQEIIDTMS